MCQPPARTHNAAVFDLDGTLVDSLPDIAAAMNAVLAARGFPSHTMDSYRLMIGDGALLLAERALPAAARADHNLVAACASQYGEAYAHLGHGLSRVYDGIPELLDELRASGLALAVLSNKPHALTVGCVAAFFPPGTFDHVTGASPDTPHKPNPTGLLRTLERMQVPPARCLYVGDTITDIQTGLAAGTTTIAVGWGFRDEVELRAAGAARVIHHPLDFLAALR